MRFLSRDQLPVYMCLDLYPTLHVLPCLGVSLDFCAPIYFSVILVVLTQRCASEPRLASGRAVPVLRH